MRKVLLLLVLLLSTVSGFAQFTFDANQTEEYLRKKAEQTEAKRVRDSIRQERIEDQELMANDVRYKLKWINMLTYRQTIGFVDNGYNLSYYGYLKTKSVWTYPISIKLSGSTNYNDANINPGYKDWSQSLSYWGLSGFRNLKDNWYLSLGGYIPLGWERYRYDDQLSSEKRHFHLLCGVNTEERVLYMSPNKVGLVLGAGFYQKLMNSKVYTVDVGFSLEVGLKF